jgi:hypothetical protein
VHLNTRAAGTLLFSLSRWDSLQLPNRYRYTHTHKKGLWWSVGGSVRLVGGYIDKTQKRREKKIRTSSGVPPFFGCCHRLQLSTWIGQGGPPPSSSFPEYIRHIRGTNQKALLLLLFPPGKRFRKSDKKENKKKRERVQSGCVWTPDGRRHPLKKKKKKIDPQNKIFPQCVFLL